MADSFVVKKLTERAAELWGVPLAELQGRKRTAQVAAARHAVAWSLVRRCGFTLKRAGVALGRDHSTVFHSVRVVERAQKPARDERYERLTEVARQWCGPCPSSLGKAS